jgi:hypothetical protein
VLSMEVNDELAHLFWQRIPGFSRSALLPRGEEALHPVAFKRIGFAGQCALGDIDFFGSLPCGFVEQNEGLICSYSSCSGHSVHCLMLVHSSVRARRSLFGPGISPCLSETTMRVSRVPHPS